MRLECRERFPRHWLQRKLLVTPACMAARAWRHVMHVGIANPRWQGKRSRHSRRMRKPQFYVSGKRPMTKTSLKSKRIHIDKMFITTLNVVKMTTSSVLSNGNFVQMSTFSFQCNHVRWHTKLSINIISHVIYDFSSVVKNSINVSTACTRRMLTTGEFSCLCGVIGI